MKVRVIKTNSIVNIKRKQDKYYIDDNNNPYKEDELDFDVPEDTPSDSPLPFDPLKYFNLSTSYNINHGVQLATLHMQQHPNKSGEEVGKFVADVIKTIKDL